jgi:hypothetical protein
LDFKGFKDIDKSCDARKENALTWFFIYKINGGNEDAFLCVFEDRDWRGLGCHGQWWTVLLSAVL